MLSSAIFFILFYSITAEKIDCSIGLISSFGFWGECIGFYYFLGDPSPEGGLMLEVLYIDENCKAAMLTSFLGGGPKPKISQSASVNTSYFLG